MILFVQDDSARRVYNVMIQRYTTHTRRRRGCRNLNESMHHRACLPMRQSLVTALSGLSDVRNKISIDGILSLVNNTDWLFLVGLTEFRRWESANNFFLPTLLSFFKNIYSKLEEMTRICIVQSMISSTYHNEWKAYLC